MKPMAFSHAQRRLIDRHTKQRGVRFSTMRVTARDITSNQTPVYSGEYRGLSVQGITSGAGDFAPGDTVNVAQMGELGTQVVGMAQGSRRFTQAPITIDTDATTMNLLDI